MSEKLSKETIDELRSLADQACGPGLDDAARNRLNELRRDSEAACRCYADCLRMAEMQAGQKPSSRGRGPVPGLPAPPKKRLRALDVLRTVFAVTVAAIFYFTYSEPEVPEATPLTDGVATIYLATGSENYKIGDKLMLGQGIATKGTVGIQLISGPAILIESGALRLDATAAATLMDGTISIRMPDTDRSLSLLTPHGGITILSGECGVRIDLETATVHAFTGEARVEPFIGDPRQVKPGEAVRFADDQLVTIAADPSSFKSQQSGGPALANASTGIAPNWSWSQPGNDPALPLTIADDELPAGYRLNSKRAKWLSASGPALQPTDEITFQVAFNGESLSPSTSFPMQINTDASISRIIVNDQTIASPKLPQTTPSTQAAPLIIDLKGRLRAGPNTVAVVVVADLPADAPADGLAVRFRAEFEPTSAASGSHWPRPQAY